MRLLSILMLSLMLAAGVMPSLAAADCAGHDATASTPSSDAVAEIPTTTTKTTTTTPTGG